MSTYYGELKEDYMLPRRPAVSKLKCRLTNLNLLVGLVLFIGLLLTILNIYQLHQMREEHFLHLQRDQGPITIVEGSSGKGVRMAPVVWILGKKQDNGYLDHVKAVFKRLGFYLTNGEDDWDVMWVHDYPFISMYKVMTRLQPHQRVNHFPGSGYITNKGSLATMQLDHFPKCFRIPMDKDKLMAHVKQYPDKMWVQKNNNHRGIRIKPLDELDFESEGSFVQEFVSNPLLIDKRKFDIGVYTIMTSLSPMRVYIVNDDALFRFCRKEYYPFDATDVNKYVVKDDYTPMWEMPSLKRLYTDQAYGFKESFNRYMTIQGHNVSNIWRDIHDTIRAVYLKKQATLITAAAKYKTTKNFFELVRFDFVLDENLRLYLMEVNMSPNLSTGHFAGNKRLYEHVMYNTLRVSRVASMIENHFHNTASDVEAMQVADKEISVFSDWCSTAQCQDQCLDLKCSLCHRCLSKRQQSEFKAAYLEHINRAGCMRMYPPTVDRETALHWTPQEDSIGVLNQTDRNRVMYMWFIGMCRKDPAFCI